MGVCDLEAIGDPQIFKLIRGTATLVRMWTTLECHMDPTITKAVTDKERFVAACAESPVTSRDPNTTRFLEVQTAIRVKMICDKKTSVFGEEDTSKKRNLMLVGLNTDNDVDLCEEGNTDVKRQCLGKEQNMLTKPPRQTEFGECWSVVGYPIDKKLLSTINKNTN